MKKRAMLMCWLAVIFAAMVMVNTVQAAAVYRWTRLGAAPLMSGGVYDRALLPESLDGNRDSIVRGLALAEANWNAEQVFQAIQNGLRNNQVYEGTYPLGTRFPWMIFKSSSSGVTVVRNVEWAGNEGLSGFVITCTYGQKELKFFLAKKCGNLTLIAARDISQPQAAAPYVRPAPPLPPAQSYEEAGEEVEEQWEQRGRQGQPIIVNNYNYNYNNNNRQPQSQPQQGQYTPPVNPQQGGYYQEYPSEYYPQNNGGYNYQSPSWLPPLSFEFDFGRGVGYQDYGYQGYNRGRGYDRGGRQGYNRGRQNYQPRQHYQPRRQPRQPTRYCPTGSGRGRGGGGRSGGGGGNGPARR